MAKKSKNDVPNPHSVSNRDILQRLNFLYQASVYLNTIDSSQSSPSPSNAPDSSSSSSSKRNRRRTQSLSVSDLSRSYIDTMKTVGTKTTVRMDPSVKRTLCKGCNVVLLPGSTASIRVKKSPSHRHVISYTCMKCNTTRRIPAPPTLDESFSSPSSDTLLQPAETVPGDSTTESGAQDSEKLRSKEKRDKKHVGTPRPPPLFARNAGHVVFRGNEELASNAAEGSGVYVY